MPNKASSANTFDVIILGAGAAGLMTAITAGNRGRKVLVLDHSRKLCEKIRISGGGRCNFTNLNTAPSAYISENPHFCKSALATYSPSDFIELLNRHGIKYHEKKLGQLFCDEGSGRIIDMLLSECKRLRVVIKNSCEILSIVNSFSVKTSLGLFESESLVIATGGLSIPKIGASDFGYRIAKQFGLKLSSRIAPGLVPLSSFGAELDLCQSLQGLALDAEVSCGDMSFRENILFTHKGFSGPAILQISSYLSDTGINQAQKSRICRINLLAQVPRLAEELKQASKDKTQSRKQIKNLIKTILDQHSISVPERFLEIYLSYYFREDLSFMERPCSELSHQCLEQVAKAFQCWDFTLAKNTNGLPRLALDSYEKAEVTVGGVSTEEISSKSMEAKKVKGLFFVGEVLDVTGWLGGYNLQWAWSSGYACGQHC